MVTWCEWNLSELGSKITVKVYFYLYLLLLTIGIFYNQILLASVNRLLSLVIVNLFVKYYVSKTDRVFFYLNLHVVLARFHFGLYLTVEHLVRFRHILKISTIKIA